MSDPFVAEIRIVGFNFAPRGWALCNGQLLPLSQNTALFSLLGTMYGGNGASNFALPDLQGRAVMHRGQGPGLSSYDQGQTGGSENVELLQSEMPLHNHNIITGDLSDPASLQDPTGNYLGVAIGVTPYVTAPTGATMAPTMLAPAGGSLPHNNMQPYLAMNFIIALQGIFPPRS